MKRFNARRTLKRLDLLPRWAWYVLSFCVGFGPIGPLLVYLGFHALEKLAQEEEDEEASGYAWDGDAGRYARDEAASRGAHSVYTDEDCIVSDDEDVARQWQRAEESANRAASRHAEADAFDAQPDEGGVSEVIRAGREAMRRMRRADDIIADPALSAQIVSIENSCEQILSILEQRPQIVTQLRTFLRYYLPTTLKLLDARARLENNANTPKAWEVRARISEAIATIDKAFKKQLEALDEYRFIDLESEMDVLRDMLKSDGLIDEEREADDPFGDVLARRRSKKDGASGDQGLQAGSH